MKVRVNVCRPFSIAFPLTCAVLIAQPVAAQETPSDPPANLDAFVADVMAAFEVPGLAVALVHDGRVVTARGYGVRRVDHPEPVDEHTRFGIASNTKAFTATALALLVEEERLEWDAPVIRYLPWFQMWDPWVTREITVRDLLVHRSGLGLGQGDLLGWPPSDRTREEIVRAIRWLEPVTSFRSAYAYDNVLYHVAALVIESVSGQTWEEFVRSRIVDPLGMSDTRVSRASTREGGNHAVPHARVEGVVRPVRPFDATNTNASGGINASALDMATWLRVQLDSGRVEGTARLFSPRTTAELWSIVTPIPFGPPPPELAPLARSFNGYGLGFFIRDYRGRQMITHTGSLPGYVSRLTMIPSLDLGVVVLTNAEEGAAFDAITHHVLDHYLDAPPHDWLSAHVSVDARRDSVRTQRMLTSTVARDTTSRPSLQLSEYADVYTDPWYGDVRVEPAGDGLAIRFSRTPALVGELEHWQHDTFLVRWHDRELRADAFITFDLNPDGRIEAARMLPASPDVDFSYDFQDLELRPRSADPRRP
ncbi:MAG: serine hydrolase [marine benthic group bacterium]|nr:serine hydrolase [Gemmatimonadota bacterium]MCL7973875.1 serine hydrolase [Gemmatimonadota bacterium]MCL7980835.1 serine hydrolase [Gemmatimonadota bacterium]MCL7986129.1 serine hydrolase [Gemmatimonadota bacterium]